MAKTISNRKRRTISHINADKSVNHVEYYALENGYAVETISKDYGFDLNIFTYNRKNEFENGTIYAQLKAKNKIKLVKNGKYISFPLDKKDLNLWCNELLPILIIVYDTVNKKAYWEYIQRYFQKLPGFDMKNIKTGKNILIPLTNIVTANSLNEIREIKNRIHKKLEKINSHA